MVLERNESTTGCDILIEGEKVEQVEEFVYLDNLFTNDARTCARGTTELAPTPPDVTIIHTFGKYVSCERAPLSKYKKNYFYFPRRPQRVAYYDKSLSRRSSPAGRARAAARGLQ
ncbi:hypothetical protein EVAR_70095_1 [Eumeta japonica]|uniref:Uncharacterized protein n=1 Tax=Eumeta variegata TaxID=151549 RepID=A0A4C2A0J0_EUMVA|nr:hypothetical protein EVAR_70095_1 [Eumeta japonica]